MNCSRVAIEKDTSAPDLGYRGAGAFQSRTEEGVAMLVWGRGGGLEGDVAFVWSLGRERRLPRLCRQTHRAKARAVWAISRAPGALCG